MVRAIHAGRRHIPPDIAQEIAFHAADEALSERELPVLNNVAAGKANKEIAWLLSISEDTVKTHRRLNMIPGGRSATATCGALRL